MHLIATGPGGPWDGELSASPVKDHYCAPSRRAYMHYSVLLVVFTSIAFLRKCRGFTMTSFGTASTASPYADAKRVDIDPNEQKSNYGLMISAIVPRYSLVLRAVQSRSARLSSSPYHRFSFSLHYLDQQLSPRPSQEKASSIQLHFRTLE